MASGKLDFDSVSTGTSRVSISVPHMLRLPHKAQARSENHQPRNYFFASPKHCANKKATTTSDADDRSLTMFR